MELDKTLIERRFAASFAHYDQQADVQRRICERLAECIGAAPGGCGCPMALDDCGHPRGLASPRRIFEIGAGTGFLTRCMVKRWPQAEYHINDLSPAARHFVEPIFGGGTGIKTGTSTGTDGSVAAQVTSIWGDAEAVEYPRELDLIASASAVQWFADMRRFAEKAAAALAKNGILAVATFGPKNFSEIRAAGGAGLDYLSLEALQAVFERAGLRTVHAEEWLETLSFDSPHDVLRYVKALGLNALSTGNVSAIRIERAYPHPATLTYHPIIVIGKKQ